MISGRRRHSGPVRYRRGQMVAVRSESEILATLDTDGKLDGLPFMPEMAKYCGRRFPIHRRADRVFLDHHYYVARLKEAVLLEGVRCDGGSHSGCQMGCLILWKEAWLKPAEPSEELETTEVDGRSPGETELPTTNNGRFCCQATELVGATSRLPWWDVRQYVRDLVSGEATLGQLARMFCLSAYNKFQRMLGREPYGSLNGHGKKTQAGSLDLQPGDLVEVKSKAEIQASLDASGCNRGLGFVPEMARHCGKRYRVAARVNKIIIEWSGEMRRMRNTVTLEGVTCQGIATRGCPRDCYHLWREIWLKRVS